MDSDRDVRREDVVLDKHEIAIRVPLLLTEFGRRLASCGVKVSIGDSLRANQSLRVVDLRIRSHVYFALRGIFCRRHEDLAPFDIEFARLFDRVSHHARPSSQRENEDGGNQALGEQLMRTPPESVEDHAEQRPRDEALWSDLEVLRHRDFAECTDEELATIRQLLRRIAALGPRQKSRRYRAIPTRRRRPTHARPDLHRSLRAEMRFGADAQARRWRVPGSRQRRLVLVCDVSGSMEAYSRVFLQYMQVTVAARRRVEAFAFGTRLTRVTAELRDGDAECALARAAAAVQDWSSGTRIGDAFASLTRKYGDRLGRGSVVVVLSDGWDRGDPDELNREIRQLARRAHTMIWLNPRKAQPGYEPTAQGMRTVLPYVDLFMAGNSVAALDELADVLEQGLC